MKWHLGIGFLLILVAWPAVVAGTEFRDPQVEGLELARARYGAALKRSEDLVLPKWKRAPLPGSRHAAVPRLRARLAAEGYGAASPDDPTAPELFDGALRTAVGHYQYAHGLGSTGRLDEGTVSEMRVSLSERLRRIEVAIRVREGFEGQGGDFIEVNIPAYDVRLVLDGEVVRRFRAIVGGTEDRNRTPILRSVVDRIVFNPVWRVPDRIQKEELEPREAREPGYLERNDFLRRGDSIVQLPGPQNALGRVKFLFENEYDVYLHDTPNKRLFRRKRRTLSHGCVRVEGAEELAVILMGREASERSLSPSALWEAGREKEVELQRSLPVRIVYVDVVLGPHGFVHFLDDVYGISRAVRSEREGRD